MTRTHYALLLAATLGLALGCDEPQTPDPTPDAGGPDTGGGGGDGGDAGPGLDGGTITDEEFVIAPRGDLVWKRQLQLAQDLAQGLGLPIDGLCKELDSADCFGVHLVSLGGNDPLGIGMYEPVAEPLSTTPAVVERVALDACGRAADRDAAGTPVTFTRFPLGADPLDVSTDEGRAAAHDQIDDLYKALLGRTSTELERAEITTLARAGGGVDAPSSRDFAVLACFTVATTTEFLFY
jgi:hypothetical protein